MARTPAQLERATQVAIVRWLRLVLPRGSIVAAVANEARASSADPHARARYYDARKAAGVVTGFPDLILALPDRVMFLEMKRPKGGVVSWQQALLHEALQALGHPVGIAVSIETARGFLRRHGVALSESADLPVADVAVRYEKPPTFTNDAMPF